MGRRGAGGQRSAALPDFRLAGALQRGVQEVEGGKTGMKFDFIIGNPPYQEEQISTDVEGSLKNYAPPILPLFYE